MKDKLSNFPPLIGFAAWSGTGKTTLLEKIIPIFCHDGFKIAIIKHAHHDFDIDQPGKDSFRLRKAGAVNTIVASTKRWAMIHENEQDQSEPDLWQLLAQLSLQQHDLILVEGFKHESIQRIELHRSAVKKPLLYPDDKQIIAIATDTNDKITHRIKRLDINNPQAIVDFIKQYFSIEQA